MAWTTQTTQPNARRPPSLKWPSGFKPLSAKNWRFIAIHAEIFTSLQQIQTTVWIFQQTLYQDNDPIPTEPGKKSWLLTSNHFDRAHKLIWLFTNKANNQHKVVKNLDRIRSLHLLLTRRQWHWFSRSYRPFCKSNRLHRPQRLAHLTILLSTLIAILSSGFHKYWHTLPNIIRV
jgi:hypothetical protein